MKRFVSLILILAVALSLLAVPGVAQAEQGDELDINLQASTAVVTPGGEVTLTVDIGAFTDLGSMQFTLNYDTSRFAYTSHAGFGALGDGEGAFTGGVTINTEVLDHPDQIRVSAAQAGAAALTGDAGDILQVVLTAKADAPLGAASFTLTEIELGKGDGINIYTRTVETPTAEVSVESDENTPPALKDGVEQPTTAQASLENAYTLDLSTIFEDAESDALTYTVRINGETAEAADENYSFTAPEAGEYTLVFAANDGIAESTETYTVTLTVLGADEPGTFSDPTIEIKLPEETLAAGENFEAELWLYSVEGVKSSNICFDPDVNVVFRDPADNSLLTSGSFENAVEMEAGIALMSSEIKILPIPSMAHQNRWQLKWNSPEGISADKHGVKVATFSLQMTEAGIPQFDWKNVGGNGVPFIQRGGRRGIQQYTLRYAGRNACKSDHANRYRSGRCPQLATQT